MKADPALKDETDSEVPRLRSEGLDPLGTEVRL